ncbi:MAG: hypothetical protein PHE06_10045, partial [Lachnospiraceae bacterium]|nr:hypothetical protein [Lachnospiraceae bacterium]
MMKGIGNKGWLLRGVVLILCLGLTGCYPDGKRPLGTTKETEDNYTKDVVENASNIECELAEGLYVNAELNINQDAEWKDIHVLLKNWDIENVSTVFGNGKKITETKTVPNMHNDKLNDQYIYLDDRSMLIIQPGNLQYYTELELNYAYLGYLYGTMPYLT